VKINYYNDDKINVFRLYQEPYTTISCSTTSTNISSIHLEVKNMQIDAIQYKLLSTQEKKCHLNEDLWLYCGESNDKVSNCHKK